VSGSIKEAAETAVVERLLTITGISSAKAIPGGQMFKMPGEGQFDLVPQTLPDVYDGCVVSLVERDTEPVSEESGFSSASMVLESFIYIAIYATSPSGGTAANDARYKAWELGELSQRSFLLLHVPGAWQTKFVGEREIPVDATTHGLMLAYKVIYQFAEKE